MYKIFLVRLAVFLAKMVHLHAPECEPLLNLGIGAVLWLSRVL